MSHSSLDMDRVRKNNRFRGGNAQRVREALGHSTKPISVYKIQLYTGLDANQVRHALCYLVEADEVVSERGPKNVAFYKLWTPNLPSEPEPRGPYAIAGKITIPQFRWNGTRLG